MALARSARRWGVALSGSPLALSRSAERSWEQVGRLGTAASRSGPGFSPKAEKRVGAKPPQENRRCWLAVLVRCWIRASASFSWREWDETARVWPPRALAPGGATTVK